MSWASLQLSEVAPARPLKTPDLSADAKVWQITLDHIEANTGRLIERNIKPLSEAGTSTHWFDERHVLYSKLRPYLNKAILPDGPGLGTTELVPMLPDRSRLDRSYLVHYLRSPRFVSWVSNQTAGAKMPRVSMKVFWDHEIPLPPLDEQKRIAAILDKADNVRRKRQQAIELADELLRSVFLDMFGDPVANPKAWSVEPLGELVENLDGKRVPIKASERADMSGSYPYYGASGIIDYVDRFIFEGRNLLVGEDGANLLARSTPIAFIAEGRYWVNNHAHVLSEKNGISLDYLRYSLNLRSIASFTSGSAQPKLNQRSLNSIPVQVPPSELLNRFDSIVERQGTTIKKMKSARCEPLFSSLSQKAFSGAL